MTHPRRPYDNITSMVAFSAAVSTVTFCLTAAFALAQAPPLLAQDAGLSGRWALDREHSELPREVGFDAPFMPTGDPSAQPAPSGGRGGRRGNAGRGVGSGAFNPRVESADDAKRREVLTAEVRSPSAMLSVVDTGDTVAIADDQIRTR